MITLTVTTTKQSADPWVTIETDGTMFTQAEHDTVINPYLEYINGLEGLEPNGYSDTFSEDGNSHILSYKFDSIANMNKFTASLATDPRAVAKIELFKKKIDALGIKYSSKSEIVDDSVPTVWK